MNWLKETLQWDTYIQYVVSGPLGLNDYTVPKDKE